MNTNLFNSKILSLNAIDNELIAQWSLFARSITERNPYLAPEFILPAIRYLDKGKKIIIVAVWKDDKREILCGFGVFSVSKGDRHFPLPHFVCYQSKHSYLSGILLDNQMQEPIVNCMLESLKKSFPFICGVRLLQFDKNSSLGEYLRALPVGSGIRWHLLIETKRAYLNRSVILDNEKWDEHISSKRSKNFRRTLSKLEKDFGQIEWRVIQSEINDEHISKFLELENSGWKGDEKSSLASCAENINFFQQMTSEFGARKEFFFTELLVGGKVIASSANFMIARQAFAFKVGMDQSFYDYSPGIINEMMFLKNLASLEFDDIDSGADESSFMNSYWPERKTLISGMLVFGTISSLVMHIVTMLKKIKKRLKF